MPQHSVLFRENFRISFFTGDSITIELRKSGSATHSPELHEMAPALIYGNFTVEDGMERS
jgi:hypothetical protein